jgi:hypothetical protein
MAIALIAAAAMAVLGVLAGEASDLPFAGRRSAAGRSRLPAPAHRAAQPGGDRGAGKIVDRRGVLTPIGTLSY